MQRQQKITLGEMRSSGPTRLLVYCGYYKCARPVIISAERWPDDVRLSELEPTRKPVRICSPSLDCLGVAPP